MESSIPNPWNTHYVPIVSSVSVRQWRNVHRMQVIQELLSIGRQAWQVVTACGEVGVAAVTAHVARVSRQCRQVLLHEVVVVGKRLLEAQQPELSQFPEGVGSSPVWPPE